MYLVLLSWDILRCDFLCVCIQWNMINFDAIQSWANLHKYCDSHHGGTFSNSIWITWMIHRTLSVRRILKWLEIFLPVSAFAVVAQMPQFFSSGRKILTFCQQFCTCFELLVLHNIPCALVLKRNYTPVGYRTWFADRKWSAQLPPIPKSFTVGEIFSIAFMYRSLRMWVDFKS